jgi:hypothetical protein
MKWYEAEALIELRLLIRLDCSMAMRSPCCTPGALKTPAHAGCAALRGIERSRVEHAYALGVQAWLAVALGRPDAKRARQAAELSRQLNQP